MFDEKIVFDESLFQNKFFVKHFEFDQTIFHVCIVFHYFIKQVKKKQSIESRFERFTS